MSSTHREYVRQNMPLIGIGTWQIKKEQTLYEVIDAGLKNGYRFIDTAQVYQNEAAIGRCLERLLPIHGLTRKDIFITSKLAPSNAGAEKAPKSIENSLKDLKIDYLDLLLIHWPGSWLKSEDEKNRELRKESWKVLEGLLESGKLKSIGVSNFEIQHLEELKNISSIVPSVNQVEYHPHFHQDDLVKYCQDNDIHFQDEVVKELAEKYEVSIPVLLLGFAYCQGISVLPRTTNPEHAIANFKVTKLDISQEDIEKLLKINVDHKTCWDPRVVS